MSSGNINFSNGEKISWQGKMPPLEVLYKYKKYIENDNDDDDNINKYLPIKYQRKMKLEKLNKNNESR